MQDDIEDLHRFREKVSIARAKALRLGHTELTSVWARSVAGIDLTIEELE